MSNNNVRDELFYGIFDMIDQLSDGDKQHLVNKLYKDEGIYPQKLRTAVIRDAALRVREKSTGGKGD